MEVGALLREDDAISSVLGVVLLVSVTIVLAAVVGVFVLGLGEGLTDPSPQVSFEFDSTVREDPAEPSTLVVLHGGGDRFDNLNVEITVGGETAYSAGRAVGDYSVEQRWPAQVRGSDRLVLRDDGDDMERGDSVLIIWSQGDHASIVGRTRLD